MGITSTSFASVIDMARRSLFLLSVIALLVQGCVLKPEPTTTDVAPQTLPNTTVPEAWKAFETGTSVVENGWLKGLGDPRLEALVGEALAYNTDLQTAAARMEQAAANVRIAGGELY